MSSIDLPPVIILRLQDAFPKTFIYDTVVAEKSLPAFITRKVILSVFYEDYSVYFLLEQEDRNELFNDVEQLISRVTYRQEITCPSILFDVDFLTNLMERFNSFLKELRSMQMSEYF